MGEMKRIYYGGLSNETNAFSPIPCSREDFLEIEPGWVHDPGSPFASALRMGCELVIGSNRVAQPAGLVVDCDFAALSDALLAEIAGHLPLDGVLLNLHGAMATRRVPDCEGDILDRVRQLAGPRTFVGATLDPHCHLSPRMLSHADVLVCYKEYPHTDIASATRWLTDICLDQIVSRRPIRHAVFDCGQIDLYYTTHPLMRQLIEEIREIEKRPEILSISIVHGFPWGDDENLGTKVLAYGRETLHDLEATVADIGRKLVALRGACGPNPMSVAEALAIASSQPGLTVAADIADNPGGGAPGDATFMLREMLAAGIAPCSLGPIWDPVAVDFAFKAGIGERLSLRIGGKAGSSSGAPLDVEATVVALLRDYAERAPGYGDLLANYGDIAGIEVAGITVVLCSRRMQAFSPALFEAVGVRLSEQRLVVVKSTQHFYAGFAPRAARVLYVNATGALNFDFASLPRRRTPRHLWPLDERNV